MISTNTLKLETDDKAKRLTVVTTNNLKPKTFGFEPQVIDGVDTRETRPVTIRVTTEMLPDIQRRLKTAEVVRDQQAAVPVEAITEETVADEAPKAEEPVTETRESRKPGNRKPRARRAR